jgi:hypothetical protein
MSYPGTVLPSLASKFVLFKKKTWPDELRQLLEPLNDLGSSGLEGDPILGHDQGEHSQRQDLWRVSLRIKSQCHCRVLAHFTSQRQG